MAGITCGHFLVPFSTFFGATFVGKAAIKAAMQTWFIILIFSKKSLQWLLAFLQKHSTYLHDQVKEILFHQKLKFETVSSDAGSHQHNPTGLLAVAWNSLIGVMIAYFLLSIVHSVASSKLKREQKKNK